MATETSGFHLAEWGLDGSNEAVAAQILGRSLARSDSVNNHTSTTTGGATFRVGRVTVNSERYHGILRFPTPSTQPRNVKVVSAKIKLGISGFLNISPSYAFNVYLLRRRLDPAFAGLTFANWTTGQAWQDYGARIGGLDTRATPLVTHALTTDEMDGNDAGAISITNMLVIDVPIPATEMESILDNEEEVAIVIMPTWAAGADRYITLMDPSHSDHNARAKTYLELKYLNNREARPRGSAGGPDQAIVLDINELDLDRRISLGSVQRGTQGTAKQYFLQNERESVQQHVAVVSPKALAGSVDSSGAASGAVLNGVIPNEDTPGGTYRFTMTSATLCDVDFLATNASAWVSLGTGYDITTNMSVEDETATFEVLEVPRKHADSVNWLGTPATDDVFQVDVRASLATTDYPLSTLDNVYVAPPAAWTGAGRDTAYLSKKRRPGGQWQLIYNTEVFANADDVGASGAVQDVTDAGSWTHIKVPDPTQFSATTGQPNNLCTLVTSDDETRAEVTVVAVYGVEHATYPGQIRIARLANSEDFNDRNAWITGGIAIGSLDPAVRALLATAASTTSNGITTDTALYNSDNSIVEEGTLTIFDPTAEDGEAVSHTTTFTSTGTNHTLTDRPDRAYPAGSLVTVETESAAAPFFVVAAPELTTLKGKKQGILVHTELSLAE
jgi:hypothetical protein